MAHPPYYICNVCGTKYWGYWVPNAPNRCWQVECSGTLKQEK